ncbi:MAG: hypothetical protein R2856_37850 [Caldilineaceae bacterium]
MIHPPVDATLPRSVGSDGRLLPDRQSPDPYKRIDLAVDAFARLPAEKLIVVGKDAIWPR